MRRLAVFVVALLAASFAGGIQPASAQVDPQASEAAFVSSINSLRASKGLGRMAVHDELVGVARGWAAVMADADRISHNPGLARAVQADWQKLGENVGVGVSVEKLHRAFIDSPTHYKNLVDPDFTHVGVGVVLGRDGVIFTAHQFMQLRPARAAATPPPAAPSPRRVEPAEPAAEPERAEVPAPPSPTPAAASAGPATPPVRLILVLEQLRELDRR